MTGVAEHSQQRCHIKYAKYKMIALKQSVLWRLTLKAHIANNNTCIRPNGLLE